MSVTNPAPQAPGGKALLESKTFWVNLLALAAMAIQLYTGFAVPPEYQLAALGIINMLVRTVTKQPIVWIFPLFIAASVMLSACASGSLDPQQTVFQAESDYTAILKVANTYASLPTCTTPNNPPCKTPSVLTAMKKADLAAQAALSSAENTVRDPKFSGTISDKAIVAATNAVAAFQNITNIATGK